MSRAAARHRPGRDADAALAARVLAVADGARPGRTAPAGPAAPAGGSRAGRRAAGPASTAAVIAADDGRRTATMGLVTPVEPVPLGDLGRVHFAAIGGAGMSGIARIMLARGVPVSGCDSAASAQLDELGAARRPGLRRPFRRAPAVTPTRWWCPARSGRTIPSSSEARRRGMRVLHRAAALASVMLGRQSIAVAGTHGKTTTTSMLTTVLRRCGADPGLRHRRDPGRDRPGRRRRPRPGVRRRGRRERRIVPDARARRGDRHLRRGRSPRQLRQPGGDRGGVRGVRRRGSRPAGCW